MSTLCEYCSKITFDGLRAGVQTVAPTYIELIASAKTCKLCKLVAQALQSNHNFIPPTSSDDEAKRFRFPAVRMWIIPEGNSGSTDKSTKPVELSSDSSLLNRFFVLIKYSDSVITGLTMHNADSKHPVLAALTIKKDIDLTFEFPKKCLSICEAEHADFCAKPISAAPKRPPARLYNIEKRCLEIFNTSTGAHVKYTTLSYLWGGNRQNPAVPLQIHTLGGTGKLADKYIKAGITERNFEARCKPGGLDLEKDSFSPMTYRCAVDATRRLGINYVWIDSVCIIQSGDDGADQKAHFNNFDGGIGQIYENSIVTLTAVGDSARFDMYGPRRVYTPQDDDAAFLSDGKIFLTARNGILQESLQYGEDSSSPNTVGNPRWDARAWPFQERMLSRRLLYFTEEQEYFECRQVYAERGDTGSTSAFRQRLRATTSTAEMIDLWPDIVADYSGRQLSYWSDRLNAISAVATQMSMRATKLGLIPKLTFNTFCGVFLESLARDLWWLPNGGQTVDNDYLGRTKDAHWRPPVSPPPSWSWGMWKGKITYPRPLHGSTEPCLAREDFDIIGDPSTKDKNVILSRIVVKKPHMVSEELVLAKRNISTPDDEVRQQPNYDFGFDGAPKNLYALQARTEQTNDNTNTEVGWAHVDPEMARLGQKVVAMVMSENKNYEKQFVSWNVVLFCKKSDVAGIPSEEQPIWAKGETILAVTDKNYVRVGMGEVWKGNMHVGDAIEIV